MPVNRSKICALDYETTGLAFWEPDFRVVSASFAFFEAPTKFLVGEENVGGFLNDLVAKGFRFVVHNAKFESGVTKYRYGIELPIEADTMRLAQNYGAPSISSSDGKEKLTFKLSALVDIYFGIPDYKKVFFDQLTTLGYENPGANLQHLPPEQLEKYNNLDAEYTLRIYAMIVDYFESIAHGWQKDSALFTVGVRAIRDAEARGVKVDREKLASNIALQEANILAREDKFRADYKEHCEAVLDSIALKKWKSLKGREQGRAKLVFKLSSASMLGKLFVGRLGIEPQFMTPKGTPSTKASHLPSYGEAGKQLADLGSQRLKLKQMRSLLEASEKDGRWHPSYQLVKTATGRLAGGSGESASVGPKLNPQGLARRFKPLMECIVADPDHVFISIDLSSGEPTVLTHYSKDPNYFAATFGMIGKAPYYTDTGLLMIDDLYFMGASVSPTGAEAIRKEFDAGTFKDWNNERTLDPSGKVDNIEWLQKKHPVLGPIRTSHKGQILGMGYEMGPKKMVQQAWDAGHTLKLEDAKVFHARYWDQVIPEVARTKQRLQYQYKQKGHLVNAFGFLLRPSSPHKCLNYFIQSSVSGIMYVILHKLMFLIPDLKCEGIIHDELILQVHKDAVEDTRDKLAQSVHWLNDQLKWSVKIRTGFAVGGNFFEAK